MSSMTGAKISVNPHPIAPFVPALEGLGVGETIDRCIIDKSWY